MYTLYLHMRATKRIYFHQILDGEDNLIFSAKSPTTCINWLAENDQGEFDLFADPNFYRVTIKRVRR